MKMKSITVIIYLAIINQISIQADQDVNRYYGRMGQDSQRYYGAYERDTFSHPASCHCNKNCNNQYDDSWSEVTKIPVTVTSSTDNKRKKRKTKKHFRLTAERTDSNE